MKKMGLPYGCLVAFSGTVHDTDSGVDYTEEEMNGLTTTLNNTSTAPILSNRLLTLDLMKLWILR